MLVICEDCAKKYSIDEQRIKAPKVKFKCRACNHIIIVEKPKKSKDTPSEDLSTSLLVAEQGTAEHKIKEKGEQRRAKRTSLPPPADPSPSVRAALRHSAAAAGKGMPFFVYLLAIMLVGLLSISTIFVHFYLKTIPDVLQHQLELRSQALTESLKGTIASPLSRKDYLTVNQEVKRISKLSGVAYVAVRNKQGVVLAGFFGNLNRFDNHFAQKNKEKGFQTDFLTKNTITPGTEEAGVKLRVGGLSVYDQVMALPAPGGELHVGLYVDELEKHFLKALFSPLTLALLLLFVLSAYILFVLLDKLITEPMRSLTNVANRISLGELDLAIMAAGPREIRELGAALERMRHSIKVAMERLSR
ncbi:MAG: zinc-ribbon domain-containing protein [Candidatus Electrothrix sp. GW3-4]|uniref:zinc-ribbon domain-containing protein n=1 Tax=Candidatus Electrothrix sp. GW3-4 TaxID=3126740 RepID=UPI0030D2869F